MNTPFPTPTEIAKCPNCKERCGLMDGDDGFFVECDGNTSLHEQSNFEPWAKGAPCGYRGPLSPDEAEAIRLHNLLCRPAPETQAVASLEAIRGIMDREIDRIAGLLTSDVRDCSKGLDAAFMGHEFEVRHAFIKTLNEEIGDMLDGLPSADSPRKQEPVAWMWQYIGKDPMADQIKPCARSLHDMDPHKPPYPDKWRPEYPLYRSPVESVPTTKIRELEKELRETASRPDADKRYAGHLRKCANRLSAIVKEWEK